MKLKLTMILSGNTERIKTSFPEIKKKYNNGEVQKELEAMEKGLKVRTHAKIIKD